MASAPLGNHIFRSAAAVPARKAISNCAILRSASFVLPRSLLFFSRETFSRPPKATPSQKYVYPDPIPEFASAETQKFKAELLKKLSKEKSPSEMIFKRLSMSVPSWLLDTSIIAPGFVFLDFASLHDSFIGHHILCFVILLSDLISSAQVGESARSHIFSEFLHKDYGGPGTLLIEPFTDMMVALKEKNLPGAPLAARASLLWAQNYIDEDWEDWNSISDK
ncbi:protein PLASTID REDOX INSENSITIVE 2, chloroplastic [Sesamum angolense]|uniref:Protein PLASTID REDOX INSENSITIVE 2, chloroplastic n=1 Tax=Sesamum angolense TaxID=2727404 RepID=A0AAE1WUB6_9LAMI|nr:protein PLASTID REDOX INSENSITIVE 2, chloroplastic [Sesamum angolense]